MNTDSLADLLSSAYKGNATAPVPTSLEPADMEGAYAVQKLFLERLGVAAGGWKIGATSPKHWPRCSTHSPTAKMS